MLRIQRRHQKIIEEAPAPNLSDDLRSHIIDAALRLARTAGYRNAGTFEFLVDGVNFYFLEVNARLQVEHPVTELCFGRDLVCDQLEIAAGGRIADPQTARGSAIECRINAEDASHDFRPATGTVAHLDLPFGPGVRVDTHMAAGAVISPYYDSLIAKLICHGENRERARARMAAALGEFSLLGVQNTAAFLRDIIVSAPFAEANLSTRFLPEFFPHWTPAKEDVRVALAVAAMVAQGALQPAQGDVMDRGGSSNGGDGRTARSPWSRLGGVRVMGPAMKLREAGGTRQFDVEILARDGHSVRLRIDGEEISVDIEPTANGGMVVRSDDAKVRVNVAQRRNSILVAAGVSAFEFVSPEGRRGRGAHGLATPEVAAPMPGKVLKVMVTEGETVAAGQALIVLEAMKMETTLYAESAAVVRKVRAEPGAMVDHGAVLLELSPADSSKPDSAGRDG